MPGSGKGFGWKRWSRQWLYGTSGCSTAIGCVGRQLESRSGTIGPINLDRKQAGKPSAGNPHAGFGVRFPGLLNGPTSFGNGTTSTFIPFESGAAAFAQAPPSDRIRLGVIGSGGRGTFVMTVVSEGHAACAWALSPTCTSPIWNGRFRRRARVRTTPPKIHRNYKDLLADQDIDAVLIATPEHWHHRMVLDALAAGKDVYVEKPLCQTPEQGVELVEAEKRSQATSSRWECSGVATICICKGGRLVAAGTLGNCAHGPRHGG